MGIAIQQSHDAAFRSGISVEDLECLLEGTAYFTVEVRLGVPMATINHFIDRNLITPELASRFKLPMTAAHRLGASLGRQGRIGLILGMLME